MKGGCLCGSVRYEISEPAVGEMVCHCKHCQRQTGTAFSVLVAANSDSFELAGEVSCYLDTGESGATLERYFCGKCGSPIYTAVPANPGVVVVKAGTLDDTNALYPRLHVWCDRAWPWVAFPEKAIKVPKNLPAK